MEGVREGKGGRKGGRGREGGREERKMQKLRKGEMGWVGWVGRSGGITSGASVRANSLQLDPTGPHGPTAPPHPQRPIFLSSGCSRRHLHRWIRGVSDGAEPGRAADGAITLCEETRAARWTVHMRARTALFRSEDVKSMGSGEGGRERASKRECLRASKEENETERGRAVLYFAARNFVAPGGLAVLLFKRTEGYKPPATLLNSQRGQNEVNYS